MNLCIFCCTIIFFSMQIENAVVDGIQDSEIQALSTTLKQYNAGLISEIIYDINSNCSDDSGDCSHIDSQYKICTDNNTEEALTIASDECKVTCHVCPVFNEEVTLFAPFNTWLSRDLIEDIGNHSILGTRMLNSTAVSGRLYLKDAKDGDSMLNLNGALIHIITYKIKGQSDIILANGVEVLHRDIHAGRNLLHLTIGLVQNHGNVIDVLQSIPTAHDFLLLLRRAGLVDHLKDSNNRYTVFLPSNYAFATNGVKLMRTRENIQYLGDVLRYHILYSPYYTVGLPSNPTKLTTALYSGGEQHLMVNKTMNGILVNNLAQVYKANITASNGVIHFIDHVLFPAISAGPVG